MGERDEKVNAELVAVITAVQSDTPLVLTTADGLRLPSGPLQPEHSMQAGMRAWVTRQTGYELGYVEQLYTFADRSRGTAPVLEVSYLGLTTVSAVTPGWRSWLEYFPWEDRRTSDDLTSRLAPGLRQWASNTPDAELVERRLRRCQVNFGLDGEPWLPELALQRYELLYEAGLVPEAGAVMDVPLTGQPMERHHRRILATGIGRLRTKIQYRPVIFELLPESFTLGRLQGTVEAVAGQLLHKQNFRRLVEQQELVEETGAVDARTGGRPAKLYRFRRAVLDERDAVGTKLPIARAR